MIYFFIFFCNACDFQNNALEISHTITHLNIKEMNTVTIGIGLTALSPGDSVVFSGASTQDRTTDLQFTTVYMRIVFSGALLHMGDGI
jgi:hypothetical protein